MKEILREKREVIEEEEEDSNGQFASGDKKRPKKCQLLAVNEQGRFVTKKNLVALKIIFDQNFLK